MSTGGWGLRGVEADDFLLGDVRDPDEADDGPDTAAYPPHDAAKEPVLADGETVVGSWRLAGCSTFVRRLDGPEGVRDWVASTPGLPRVSNRSKGRLVLTDRRLVATLPKLKLVGRDRFRIDEHLASAMLFRLTHSVYAAHVLLEAVAELQGSGDELSCTTVLETRRARRELRLDLRLSGADAAVAMDAVVAARRRRWDGLATTLRPVVEGEAVRDGGGSRSFESLVVRPLGAATWALTPEGRRQFPDVSGPGTGDVPSVPSASRADHEAAAGRTGGPWRCPRCGRDGNRDDRIRCIGCRSEIPIAARAVDPDTPPAPPELVGLGAYDGPWVGA
ncbi:hypothetical protein [Patulibacter minatonensis]|uniref:hypothetical protein n=1 Tax=Patulibacter minatonensis TaxID=298163 RepID=UPI0012F71644|nr:hypothetical protein [Patulibacter minatonensis]